LTPPEACDNLTQQVAEVQATKTELSAFRIVLVVNAAGATQLRESQSWIPPTKYLRRITIDDP